MKSCVFQMAWASKEEEAMNVVRLHMGIMEERKKKELSELYDHLIFPRRGHAWSDIKWSGESLL